MAKRIRRKRLSPQEITARIRREYDAAVRNYLANFVLPGIGQFRQGFRIRGALFIVACTAALYIIFATQYAITFEKTIQQDENKAFLIEHYETLREHAKKVDHLFPTLRYAKLVEGFPSEIRFRVPHSTFEERKSLFDYTLNELGNPFKGLSLSPNALRAMIIRKIDEDVVAMRKRYQANTIYILVYGEEIALREEMTFSSVITNRRVTRGAIQKAITTFPPAYQTYFRSLLERETNVHAPSIAHTPQTRIRAKRIEEDIAIYHLSVMLRELVALERRVMRFLKPYYQREERVTFSTVRNEHSPLMAMIARFEEKEALLPHIHTLVPLIRKMKNAHQIYDENINKTLMRHTYPEHIKEINIDYKEFLKKEFDYLKQRVKQIEDLEQLRTYRTLKEKIDTTITFTPMGTQKPFSLQVFNTIQTHASSRRQYTHEWRNEVLEEYILMIEYEHYQKNKMRFLNQGAIRVTFNSNEYLFPAQSTLFPFAGSEGVNIRLWRALQAERAKPRYQQAPFLLVTEESITPFYGEPVITNAPQEKRALIPQSAYEAQENASLTRVRFVRDFTDFIEDERKFLSHLEEYDKAIEEYDRELECYNGYVARLRRFDVSAYDQAKAGISAKLSEMHITGADWEEDRVGLAAYDEILATNTNAKPPETNAPPLWMAEYEGYARSVSNQLTRRNESIFVIIDDNETYDDLVKTIHRYSYLDYNTYKQLFNAKLGFAISIAFLLILYGLANVDYYFIIKRLDESHNKLRALIRKRRRKRT